MKRIAAHLILFNGETYHLSIASIAADGKTISITPLSHEVHSTVFINGCIEIWAMDGQLHYRKVNQADCLHVVP